MQYDLVFEGGGAKGIVFVGALKAFEAQGHTFGRLLGTSAGAITATLLAAGYDAQEIGAAIEEKQDGRSVFARFMGIPAEFDEEEVRNSATRALLRDLDLSIIPNFIEEKLDDEIVQLLAGKPRFRHLFSFIERGGWYGADDFLAWMERKLNTGTYKERPRDFGRMNLGQFFQATQVELSLVASDTTAGGILVLNHRTAPNCPLVWAVRMSMSIPFLWQEVVWQSEWGLYRGQDIVGHTIVDGGMLSNFPIELFVSSLPVVVAVMGPKTSQRVLGFLIDETLPVKGAPVEPPAGRSLSWGSLPTVQRILHLVNTMMQAHDKMVIESFEELVVRLPAKGYGTTDFDMSDERRERLVTAGGQAMRQYFAGQLAPETVSVPAEVVFSAPRVDASARPADRIAARILGSETPIGS